MWAAHLKGVPTRVDNTAVSIQGKIYSFDFQDEHNPFTSRNLIDVYIFDPASYRWEIVQTQALSHDEPIGIYRHTIVSYGHCAYVWGGWDRGISPNELYRFDTRTLKWSRPKVSGQVPEWVSSHSACVVGRRMYIFADILDGYSSRRVWFLDLKTMKWRHVPIKGEDPAERLFPTVSAIGTRMYLWGGCVIDRSHADRFVYDDDIYYLETTTSTWVRPVVEGYHPVGRQGHCAFVHDEKLYIFGGHNLDTCFSDLHRYDPIKSSWTEVKPSGAGPCAMHSHGCCKIGERVFIFNGFSKITIWEKKLLTDLHVLLLAPTLKNLCVLAVINAGLDLSRFPPLLRSEINAFISSQS